MCQAFETFWSSIKTIFRIITLLCIVCGVIAVIVTASTYNSRDVMDSIKFHNFHKRFDPKRDYSMTLLCTILSTFLICIGWEAIALRFIILMHVYAWGMLVLSICMLIFILSHYKQDFYLETSYMHDEVNSYFELTRKYQMDILGQKHMLGWIGNYHAIPRIRELDVLQKAFECCARKVREYDYFFLYNRYHGKYHDLPYTCCRNGFYLRRCKWGENYSKGCPERLKEIVGSIRTACRIVLTCHLLTLLLCAVWGISCVVYLHTCGYRIKLHNIREHFTTRAHHTFGVRDLTSEDRQDEEKKKKKITVKDDSDSEVEKKSGAKKKKQKDTDQIAMTETHYVDPLTKEKQDDDKRTHLRREHDRHKIHEKKHRRRDDDDDDDDEHKRKKERMHDKKYKKREKDDDDHEYKKQHKSRREDRDRDRDDSKRRRKKERFKP